MVSKVSRTLASISVLVAVGVAGAGDSGQQNLSWRQDAAQPEFAKMGFAQEAPGADENSSSRQLVDEAQQVVEEIQEDPELVQLLSLAQGIFIAPHYSEPAEAIGGGGGEGVVLLRERDNSAPQWTAPAFYRFSGTSLGANVGDKAASIAVLMMTSKATDLVRHEEEPWTLQAGNGLIVANYSTATEMTFGDADMVFWSNAAGAYAGDDIRLNNMQSNEEENRAYYGLSTVDARQILTGRVSNEHADSLREELSEN